MSGVRLFLKSSELLEKRIFSSKEKFSRSFISHNNNKITKLFFPNHNLNFYISPISSSSRIAIIRNYSSLTGLKMSSSSQQGERAAAAEEDDVIIETINNKGIITLNRPKALNSLNLSMIRKIYPVLREWEISKNHFVVIKASGGKAFCAGGDIVAVTESAKAGTSLYKDFFKEEYYLNALIGTYQIPYIALIDGITMGGGVGLSVHGKYRVATERTLFAMPETAIGLFPDVGGSYFLPRLGGKLGLYLALTGYRLKGGDNFKAGIATHMCSTTMLPALEQDLISLGSNKPEDIESVLKKYHNQCPEYRKEFTLAPHINNINKLFSGNSVEEIIQNLKSESSDWSKKNVEILEKMSPTSLKISHELLRLGAEKDMQECLRIEYRLSQRCSEDNDFVEGVRALLKDKDQNPKWKPNTLAGVTNDIIKKYFSPLPPESELNV